MATNRPKFSQKVLARAQIGPQLTQWIDNDESRKLLDFLKSAQTNEQEQGQLADWVASALYYKEYMHLTAMLRLIDELSIEEALIKRAADYLQQFVIDNCYRDDLTLKKNAIVARLIQGSLTVPKYISVEAFDLCKSVILEEGKPAILAYPASAVLLATSADPWIVNNGVVAFDVWSKIASDSSGSATCFQFAIKWLERAAKEIVDCKPERRREVAKIVSQVMDKHDYTSWFPIWSSYNDGHDE